MDHSQHQSADTLETEEDTACIAVGILALTTDGSGTSLLPGREGSVGSYCGGPPAGSHSGLRLEVADNWMVMVHGYAWGVYADQSGPRGDDKAYVQSMAMFTAEKTFEGGRLQLKSMFSLEPLMSNRGYPNLFATGETAGGEPLVDRQHPHDLFMELAARVDIDAGYGSVFL